LGNDLFGIKLTDESHVEREYLIPVLGFFID